MSTGRTVAVVVLGIVLVGLLVASSAVIAMDRTVLDASHVSDTAADEGVHEELTAELHEDFERDMAASNDEWPLERSESDLAAEAIDEAYVQSQLDGIIESTYDYLHGDTDELRLEMDTDPIRETVVAELETEMEDVDLEALDVPDGAAIEAMAESEQQFDEHRDEAREEFEAEAKAQAKAEIQDETDRELTDEQLEQAFEQEFDEAEFDQYVDEMLHEIREELYAEKDERIDEELDEPALEEPVRDLGGAYIDAQTEVIGYDEYVSQVETAKDDLGDAVVETFEAELEEELPGTVDLTEEEDVDEEPLDDAREVVSILGTLVWVLPVLALGAAGLVAWLAPASTAALTVGIGSLLSGGIGLVGAHLGGAELQAIADQEAGADEVADFVFEVLGGLVDALLVQSGLLVAVGVGLIALGVAIRRGIVLEE